jgi:hypothetical protein
MPREPLKVCSSPLTISAGTPYSSHYLFVFRIESNFDEIEGWIWIRIK